MPTNRKRQSTASPAHSPLTPSTEESRWRFVATEKEERWIKRLQSLTQEELAELTRTPVPESWSSHSWLGISDEGWLVVPMPGVPHRTIEVLVRRVRGVPQLIGLKIEPANFDGVYDSEPDATRLLEGWLSDAERLGTDVAISSELLRSLPLAKLKATAVQMSEGGDPFEPLSKVERGAGGRWPDKHYQQIAEVYRRAVGTSKGPLRAIQDHWNVSKPMASKYVRRARELGFLGYPTKPGVAGAEAPTSPIGQRSTKARAVTRTRWTTKKKGKG